MSVQSRFSDPAYIDWLRDTLALLYLKEGIEDITNAVASKFHNNLIKTLGRSNCTTCSPRDMIKDFRGRKWHMNCSVCDPWLQEIVQNHRAHPLPNLYCENTDPQLWPTHPWEVIKCYMGHGCRGIHSAKDADAQNLLTMLHNCQQIATCGQVGRMDLVDELLGIRNALFHSGTLLVDRTKLQKDFQTMLDFLAGVTPKSPVERQAVTEAVRKITELQTNRIDLTLASNKDLELRALQQRQNALDLKIDLKEQELKDDIEEVKATTSTNETAVTTLQREQQELKRKQGINTCKVNRTVKKLRTNLDAIQNDLVANSNSTEVYMQSTSDKISDLEAQMKQRNQDGPREVTEHDIIRLRSELVKYYMDGQSLLVPNPVVDEALDLEEIYVRPDIKVLRETSKPRTGLKTVQPNSSVGSASLCKNLFYTEHYKNKQIYVTGNAGVGKTGLCKYLVSLWCQTQSDPQPDSAVPDSPKSGLLAEQFNKDGLKPRTETESDSSDSNDSYDWGDLYDWDGCDTYISPWKLAMKTQREENEDRAVMANFHIVFYISLRESPKHYTIADMIDTQILKQISGFSQLQATDILQRGGCLVIIDGLDEWTCPEYTEIPPFTNPGIPGRRFNEDNVFLTTARPWKLDVLKLKGLEIDKHVELCGLNETSTEVFCAKYIDAVNTLDGRNRTSKAFISELIRKDLAIFDNVPNLLILLIGLWMDNQDLGQSRLQLFCSMLEMLLKRAAEKNLPDQKNHDSVPIAWLLPECFTNRTYCQSHQHLLAHLCKVAFEFLLDPKRDDALVFNTSKLKIFGIDSIDLDLCLKSGILTQDTVLGKRSVTEKKISFLHKQLQEMLAAVYLSSSENAEYVTSRIRGFCTSVEAVLELSQVWMFLSGIRPGLARELLTELMTRVVLNDDNLQKYRRHGVGGRGAYKSIQEFIVDCVMEANGNGYADFSLPLFDFYIEFYNMTVCLENLLTTNIPVVKSVKIDTFGYTDEQTHALARIWTQLQRTSCLQALSFTDYTDEFTALSNTLVSNKDTLTSLELSCITMSPELHVFLCGSLHHFTRLSLTSVTLTHKQEYQLLSSVSLACGMQCLILELDCSNRNGQCLHAIDLSGLSHLHRLGLDRMHIDKLPAVIDALEMVNLFYVTLSESQLRQLIQQFSACPGDMTLELTQVTVAGDIEDPVDLYTDLIQKDNIDVTYCALVDKTFNLVIDLSMNQKTTKD